VNIKDSIRTIPDFPKEGVMFRDLTTLFSDPSAFAESVELIAGFCRSKEIDYIAGIESRGFIVGSAVALKLGKGFIPVRKKGKLPGSVISQTYQLEYGEDTIQIHDDVISPGKRVLIVDDLLATGGTALASAELIERAGGIVAGLAFIVNLPDLKGDERLKKRSYEIFHICSFEGD